MRASGESLGDRLRRYRMRHRPKRKRTYARFYGRYRSVTGETRGFEFQVRVSPQLSRKLQYRLITHTVNKMKYEKSLPYHKRRETFASFHELFSVPWVRIRKILDYDVQMDYPTPFD
ncbi:MAG: hypothetical protein QHH18_04400 [Candidatus Bathyarchaeota archaeon]|jgi:hypothetical protein|nr:hypothetical protein [Candidatus Bathyarchaeota archaeon A05DMB-5]MDH7557828.1 hypothetical protein [Candidatus Bathyarchaeota archaeon]